MKRKIIFVKKTLLLIGVMLSLTACQTSNSTERSEVSLEKDQPSTLEELQQSDEPETESSDAAIPDETGIPLEDGVMDFHTKLDFKKPMEPINTEPSVLFLGNSHTFYNDLPGTFLNLIESDGRTADIQECTAGSYQLSYFADPEDEVGAIALEMLQSQDWDYVVLQEHGMLAGIDLLLESDFYPSAQQLDQLVKKANGQTVMFMTWAYLDGMDLGIPLVKPSTHEQMQTSMVLNYMEVANRLDALVAPAGLAFVQFQEKYPDIHLWDQEDRMHPSEEGTYLAACVLYATLFQTSPVGLSFISDFDLETATLLQEAAEEIVLSVS